MLWCVTQTCLSKRNNMKQYIPLFLEQKQLAENSRLAYLYDLQQLLEICQDQITQSKLDIYQAFLEEAKPRVQRRKRSAANQFLYFLYENGYVEHFYKLKAKQQLSETKKDISAQTEDLTCLWEETRYTQGQLIALLIATLGLTPSEIAPIRKEQIDTQFQVLTLECTKGKRILSLPKELLPFLEASPAGVYLFDKKGQIYSRQWFFNRLSEFLSSIGRKNWTAQKLREQYILHELDAGRSVDDLAKQFGLTSRTSLEKYR